MNLITRTGGLIHHSPTDNPKLGLVTASYSRPEAIREGPLQKRAATLRRTNMNLKGAPHRLMCPL